MVLSKMTIVVVGDKTKITEQLRPYESARQGFALNAAYQLSPNRLDKQLLRAGRRG